LSALFKHLMPLAITKDPSHSVRVEGASMHAQIIFIWRHGPKNVADKLLIPDDELNTCGTELEYSREALECLITLQYYDYNLQSHLT
jgi:hypothetical protein